MGIGTQTLEELILWLKTQPKERVIEHGFGSGHSDRGNYCNVAFSPALKTTIGKMLKHAEEVLGTTQEGWKGGEFKMYGYVNAHIGDYGDCGEPVTSYNYLVWAQ